jgi:geranylgeranyl transferase type-2 subunit alpha
VKATPQPLPHQSPGNSGATLELIKNDLIFLVPLLKQWPKCYWIWDHRIWLLQQATLRLEVPIARRLWQEELALCGMMLVRDSRNFHGWGYRRMVVEQLESPALHGKSMVEDEFAYTTKMVHAHLSNFSAWHTRSKLIPRLLDERKASDQERKEFLDNGMCIP